MCPYCQSGRTVTKNGFYVRPSDNKHIQRFRCNSCNRGFSKQTLRIDFRYRKRHLDQVIFRGLGKGNSQRGLAYLLGTKQETIARRIVRFGSVCAKNLERLRETIEVDQVIFDEMESFEHTKCKPLTMPLAVEKGSRRLLALEVAPIAAKGHLAEISRRKYGPRKCGRKAAVNSLLQKLRQCVSQAAIIQTDMSRHYPNPIRKHFPNAFHERSKGRRGCVVGQGELKRGALILCLASITPVRCFETICDD